MAMLPKLKLKALVSFPSNVYGGTGIEVNKANGNFTVDLDYSEFAFQGTLPTGSNVLVWDPVTDVYTLIPPTATGGISDAPSDSLTYGRNNGAWVDAWASPILTGNPTAPTPAASDNDTSIATTAFVTAAVAAGGGGILPATATPLVESGAGAVGVSLKYAREDHVHPAAAGGGGSGDVVGPASAVADRIATFNGTTGKIIKDGGALIADLATVAAITGLVKTVKVLKFTASGTYTPSAGMLYAVIECVGGGGAGGGVHATASNFSCAGGGGGGAYARLLASAATVGASKVVTIGSGGTGAPGGATNGSPGGSTSVGAICVAAGGSGGGFTQVGVAAGAGGVGAKTGTGDLIVSGSNGGAGLILASTASGFLYSGASGGSHFSGSITPLYNADGVAGLANSGGGGSGALDSGVVHRTGGAGGSGIVAITEFCSQ